MNITILDNRDVITNSSENVGTQNENNATILNFSFPEKLINASKKIVFVTEDGVFEDIIEDNTYKLKNSITKYKSVSAYVRLIDTQNEIDFRSKMWDMNFNLNEKSENELPDEEPTSIIDTIINRLDNVSKKVEGLEDELIDAKAFKINPNKITNSTVVNIEETYPNLTNFNYGKAIPFVYDVNHKYKYLYIPKLQTLIDGYVTIEIVNSEFINKSPADGYRTVTQIKKYFKSGTYNDVIISLNDLDYSQLTNGETYWVAFYQFTKEENPVYNDISEIKFAKIDNYSNQMSGWIDTASNVYFLPNWAAWAWVELGESFYNEALPVFALCDEYPLTISLAKYVKNTIGPLSPLNNKKINFMGDSITQGINGTHDPFTAEYPYPRIIADKFSCTCRNYGIAGSTIGGDGSTVSEITGAIMGYLPMNSRMNSMDTDADYNVVFGGINDAIADKIVPIGNIDDESNLTFYGALNIIAKYMLDNFPTKKNAFITPPRNNKENTPNQYGHKVIDYVNAVVEVGRKYGIPVFNMYDNLGGTPTNLTWKNANMADGTHPNQSYYYVVADKIAAFLETL